MAQFIPVSLEDFENVFNIPSKKNPTKRAFELIRPPDSEIYYQCFLKESIQGSLLIKIYTSIAANNKEARGVGEDAIRIAVVWNDKTNWSKAIGNKPKRIYRSGSDTSTAKDVVNRAFKRAKEIAIEAMGTIMCNACGRPMVIRKGKNGDFLGCIGFSKNVCSNTRSIGAIR